MQVMLWVGSLALAADPLVTTGAADSSLRQAATGAGRPESSFTPTAWADLVGGPVAVFGAGAWTPCAGPSATLAQLTLAIEGAEGALGYGDLEKARFEIAEADRLAGCQSADPPATLLARWHLARGAVGHAASFAQARALDPSIRWNASWSGDGAAALDAPAPAKVGVAFHGWPTALRVDGGEPGAELIPGLHLVRWDATAGLLTVPDEPMDVVLTPTFPVVGPTDLADPAIRDGIAALLLVRFGAGTRVFLADGDEAWATTAGRTDWTPLRKVRRSPLIPVGLAIAGPALAGAGVSFALAQSARSDVTRAADDMAAATTTPEFDAARARYGDGTDRFQTFNALTVATGAVAVAGAGLFCVGLAQGEIVVRTALSPVGGSVDLVVRR